MDHISSIVRLIAWPLFIMVVFYDIVENKYSKSFLFFASVLKEGKGMSIHVAYLYQKFGNHPLVSKQKLANC